jgi:hypothetical protein
MPMQIEILSTRRFDWRRFVLVSLSAFAAFGFLNVLPHLVTPRESEHCGLQIMGFPFTFRSFGGYAGSVHFDLRTLTVDILIGLVLSTVIGYVFGRLRERRV